MKKVTKIKICGLKEVEDLIATAEAGADFIGLMFAESKRRVTPEKAAEMVKELRKLEKQPAVVGVFVNTPAEEVNRIARECDLDLIQLSGDEDSEYCLKIEKPVIQVIHVFDGQSENSLLQKIEDDFKILHGRDVTYMLDTGGQNTYGGTGQSFSRELATGVARRMPVMIAGGLDPENVGAMVAQVHPWGVDVSSGVETDGKKDINKIRDFINEVKAVAGG